ncbi:hypothetical protein ACPOL_6960 (plasmid) [Acidisarcina polymorpha]|uniref:Uncharacterized protein n=1 Tax=Acidisarcina polymorpha TaxID=2211140 RepID=A0A2Z5GBR2_9BACT|nr:hypothetical protein ACPOL_6960 [Acidisarcina polymorpha]
MDLNSAFKTLISCVSSSILLMGNVILSGRLLQKKLTAMMPGRQL